MKMLQSAFDHYLEERNSISPAGIQKILDGGRKWSLGTTLASGGSAIFPHTYLSQCGDQVAAVVHGCLDSGADQVVILGVLHQLSEELIRARERELEGEDVTQEGSYGVLGPGVGGDRYWKEEYSLLNFLFLWEKEVKQRGIRPPRLIVRYPSLTAGNPSRLKGVEELKSLAKDSVVVATGDLCHHGRAYGMDPNEIIDSGAAGKAFAHRQIEEALALLRRGDYKGYLEQCGVIRNDSRDTGTLLRYLLGPLKSRILDLRLIDVSGLFHGHPAPSWVAASLIVFET
ncbi:MAG: hypothetical protein K1060chlam2_00478 [Chlamydiae bacterium]|nr:hypothetical protein [Chlamydiota bacterium]